MKLLIVTTVEHYHEEVLTLLKKAEIESFSESDIDGYKNAASLLMSNSWFPSEKGVTESSMFFSFTDDAKIDVLFTLIEAFNTSLETNSPIRAVVVPIERHI